jgi:hypothetical protein
MIRTPAMIVALVLYGCQCGHPAQPVPDSGGSDAGLDAGEGDSGVLDSGITDSDSGTPDSGTSDGGCTGRAGRLDLNDVSFLFPVPGASGGLLTLADHGSRGALLPPSLGALLPNPLATFPAASLADVRIVSARVDLCFKLDSAGACRPQLRLVGQPQLNGNFVDATVHLFYELTEVELSAVVLRLRTLKQSAGIATDCRPLGVHPVMSAQGLSGAYATDLKTLLLDYCGDSNLSRVAVMKLLRPGGRSLRRSVSPTLRWTPPP